MRHETLKTLAAPFLRAMKDKIPEAFGIAVIDEKRAIGVVLDSVVGPDRFCFNTAEGFIFPLLGYASTKPAGCSPRQTCPSQKSPSAPASAARSTSLHSSSARPASRPSPSAKPAADSRSASSLRGLAMRRAIVIKQTFRPQHFCHGTGRRVSFFMPNSLPDHLLTGFCPNTRFNRIRAALLACQWDVQHEESPTDTVLCGQAAYLRDQYDRVENLREAVAFLASATFRGFAHVEMHYADGGRGIVRLEPVEQWFWCRSGMFGEGRYNRDARSGVDEGEKIERSNFAIVESPIALDRILAVQYFRRNLALRDWSSFLDVY